MIAQLPPRPRRQVFRRPLARLVLNLWLAGLAGCGGKPPDTPAAAAAGPIVEVVEVTQRDVPVYQEWVGTLDGMVNAQIRAQVTGYLIRRHFEEGQLVKQDQLLYEIDPRTFQATLDGALSTLAREEALLKTARLDYERIQRLLPERAVSVRDRDNALGRVASGEAQVMTARAAVHSAQLDLSFTRIRSPITGIIGLSQAQIGDLVGPNSANSNALTTVSQLDPIRAYISISEQDYMRFATKADASEGPPDLDLILANGEHHPRTGRFYVADRQVDPTTGTIKVATLFPNPGNILRPGQFARVRAQLRTKRGALLVPQRAVTELQGGYQLAVVRPDDTIDIRAVRPGERVASLWVIDEGLKPGERVIIEGIQKARPGLKVTPRRPASADDAQPATPVHP